LRFEQTAAKPGAPGWEVAAKTAIDAGATIIPLGPKETVVILRQKAM
jgi:hypothetical protein